MRYFRRSLPSTVVRDGNGVNRFIAGPDAKSGEPGGILAYDTSDPDQARYAEQYAHAPGWYEVDKDGTPIVTVVAEAEPEEDQSGSSAEHAGDTALEHDPGRSVMGNPGATTDDAPAHAG